MRSLKLQSCVTICGFKEKHNTVLFGDFRVSNAHPALKMLSSENFPLLLWKQKVTTVRHGVIKPTLIKKGWNSHQQVTLHRNDNYCNCSSSYTVQMQGWDLHMQMLVFSYSDTYTCKVFFRGQLKILPEEFRLFQHIRYFHSYSSDCLALVF